MVISTDKFKNYITLITAFILAATVLAAMLPDGSHKTNVKFVISAILMCIILSPLSKSKDFDINLYADEYTINSGPVQIYDEYAANKVKAAVRDAVADFADTKNIVSNDTEVICTDNKIEKIVIDKALAAYKSELSDILGISQEYIQTAE